MGNDCWKAGNAKAAGDPTLPRYGTDLVQVRSRLETKDERVVLGRGQYRNGGSVGSQRQTRRTWTRSVP